MDESNHPMNGIYSFNSIGDSAAKLSELLGDGWEDDVVPRRISPPGNYSSPKHWWAISTMKALSQKMFGDKKDDPRFSVFTTEEVQREVHMFSVTHKTLLDHAAPTYFVTKELIEALDRTDVEDTIPMEELNWPHEAMLFVLPRDIRYAEACGIFNKTSFVAMLTLTRADHVKYGKSYIVTSVYDDGTTSYAHYPCGGTYGDQMREHGDKFIMENPTDFYREEYELSIDRSRLDEDKRQINSAVRLAWKILCAMNAPNETVVVGGSLLRPSREGRGRKKDQKELWSPSILDISERVSVSDDPDGDGGKGVRLHWRRGHFRRQAYGTGRAQRRMVWIKPHKVGSL